MGLNTICVLLLVGLFFRSSAAQQGCTTAETQQVKACLTQVQNGQNANALQLVNLKQQSGPCMQQAGCSGASSGTGFGGVLSSFGFGGNNQQQQQQQPSNGNDETCYNSVTKKVHQAMGQCIKQKSNNFNPNDASNAGGQHHHGQFG